MELNYIKNMEVLGKYKLTDKDKEEIKKSILDTHTKKTEKENEEIILGYENSRIEQETESAPLLLWVFISVLNGIFATILSGVIGAILSALLTVFTSEGMGFGKLFLILLAITYQLLWGTFLKSAYNHYRERECSILESIKLAFNIYIIPIYLLILKLKGVNREDITPKELEDYNKYLVVYTFEELGEGYKSLEDINTNFEELLDILNTEVEIHTSKEVGYMTYLYRILDVEGEYVKLTTTEFSIGDEITNLEGKKLLLTDSKLDYESMVELYTNLENQSKLEIEYNNNLKELNDLKTKEEKRMEQLRYIAGMKGEYEDSKEEAKQYLTEHKLKDKWNEVLEGINKERVKLTEENKRIIEEIKGS